MKKFLVATLVAVMPLATGFAQISTSAETTGSAFVNQAGVQRAVSNITVNPAISVSGAAAGYLPVFTDTAGNLENSVISQSGSNIAVAGAFSSSNVAGIGIAPLSNVRLNVGGTLPSADNSFGLYMGQLMLQPSSGWDAYFHYGGGGTVDTGSGNIIRKAVGLYSEYIQKAGTGQISNTYGLWINPSTSGVNNYGAYIGGNVGIGTTTPAYPLTVNGAVQSVAGGFVFPDNSVQTSAAVSGVALTSPDISIVIGGNAVAPTLAVNPATIQKRVNGSCAAGSALTSVNADGTVTCGTAGSGTSGSFPVIVAQASFTGSYGLGAAQNIFTADEDAFYRVSVYMNTATAGACSSIPCASEAVMLQWNDGISTSALAIANCNLVTPCGSSGTTPIWVKSGQAISAYGQSYGSGSAPTGGTYNAYVLVEKLKK